MRNSLNIFLCQLLLALCCMVNVASANLLASEEIKSYIQNIKTIATEFTQEDSGGNIARGMLIIDKPHKFRCNYYSPYPLLIVGNKSYISVYDFEMKNLSRIKAKDNPFNFLLVDNIDFDKQFIILDSQENKKEYVVRLQSLKSDKITEVSFDRNSKTIKSLRILEEDNIIHLSFHEHFNISSPNKNLFLLKDPDLFGRPKRLSRDDLYQTIISKN